MQPHTGHPIILFDGVCNLCESTVRIIIQHDRKAVFRFASLQSGMARQLLAEYQYADDKLISVLLVSDGQIYSKSRAALRIAKRLDGAWPLLYYLFFWIPPFIADAVYNYIGNRRYRWFGKKESCWIPDDNLRQRFIDD
jgi:predicted DCC family thiol-disulfide oxidoreductase YuxK